jgi:excisionase family DNA binding protein
MKVFTIGKVARICNVSNTTAKKWFDSGKLQGYHVPGSRFRRVPRDRLLRFLESQRGLLDNLNDDFMGKVLVVTQCRTLTEKLTELLIPERSFKLAVVTGGFDTGMRVVESYPDCVIVDFSINHPEALQICQSLKDNPYFDDTFIIALLSEGSNSGLDHSHFDEFFIKPFDVNLLVERVRTLISGKKDLF